MPSAASDAKYTACRLGTGQSVRRWLRAVPHAGTPLTTRQAVAPLPLVLVETVPLAWTSVTVLLARSPATRRRRCPTPPHWPGCRGTCCHSRCRPAAQPWLRWRTAWQAIATEHRLTFEPGLHPGYFQDDRIHGLLGDRDLSVTSFADHDIQKLVVQITVPCDAVTLMTGHSDVRAILPVVVAGFISVASGAASAGDDAVGSRVACWESRKPTSRARSPALVMEAQIRDIVRLARKPADPMPRRDRVEPVMVDP